MAHFNAYGQRVFDSEAEGLAFARGELVSDSVGNLVPANKGTLTGDGLIQTTRYDATGRPIHEFRAAPGRRKEWLDQFKGPINLQTRIANSNQVAEEISKGQRA